MFPPMFKILPKIYAQFIPHGDTLAPFLSYRYPRIITPLSPPIFASSFSFMPKAQAGVRRAQIPGRKTPTCAL